jgi:hypothetical protein
MGKKTIHKNVVRYRIGKRSVAKQNDETFGDIPNVHIIADDIIIAGRDDLKHDMALNNVPKRARERNVRFSPGKL